MINSKEDIKKFINDKDFQKNVLFDQHKLLHLMLPQHQIQLL